MISTNQNVIYIGNIKCQINESIFSKYKRVNLNHKVTFNTHRPASLSAKAFKSKQKNKSLMMYITISAATEKMLANSHNIEAATTATSPQSTTDDLLNCYN